jgi:hypothetical protein
MNLSPSPIQKFFANNGRPLVGGLLFTYEAGTSDKVDTYTNAGGALNTNPIVLDFRGECRLWIDPQQAYKFVLAPRGDTDPPTNPIWTVDDITAAPLAFDNASVDIGSVNNISLNIPQISSPVEFTRVVFKVAFTNTGPTTLQINGGPAHDLVYQDGSQFVGQDVLADGFYEAVFTGGEWQLQGPAVANWITESESNAGITTVNVRYEEGDVRRYGAIADGITNDLAAFQTAARLPVVSAIGLDCVVQGQVDILDGQTWLLAGATLRMTGTTTTMLSADGVNDWSLNGPFEIVGDGSTIGTSRGVYVNNCNGYVVNDYKGTSIRGHAAYTDVGSNTVPRGDRGHWLNMRARGCWVGFENRPGGDAEYCTLTAPMITECRTGLVISAGNTIVIGGNVVDNFEGIFLGNGTNNGHGMLVGVNANHNTSYNLRCFEVSLGFDIVGCHFYGDDAIGAGKVWFDGCAGVQLIGGHIDALVENDGNLGVNYLTHVMFPGTLTSIAGTDPQFLYVNDCQTLDAGPSGLNDPSPMYVLARRSTNQTLTAGSSVVSIMDTEVSDNRLVYDNTTGVFTVPSGIPTRVYEVAVNYTVTAASGLTSAGFVSVQVNGADVAYLSLVAVSGALALASGTASLELAATDALRIQVRANAGSVTPVLDANASQMSVNLLV